MKIGSDGRMGRRLVAGLLGLTVAVTALPHAALAGYKPNADQSDHILKVESTLAAQVLVSTDMQGYGSDAIAAAANLPPSTDPPSPFYEGSSTAQASAAPRSRRSRRPRRCQSPPTARAGPATASSR